MRIVSYNMLNGGLEREDLIADVISTRNPDVVALVEADDSGVVKSLADRLGMHHVHAPSGGHHAGAILSRWPITNTINHAASGEGHWMNAFVEARVIDPTTGTEWPIVVVHFAAHASEEREQLREAQLDSLFDRLAPLRDRPHILAGDFNSNAPSQLIDPALCNPRTQREWTENCGSIPRRIVQKLLDAGYRDTLHSASPRVAETTGTYTTEFPGQRIDYIFTHGIDPSRIQSAWIDQSPQAAKASDHFSIGADIT
ncbi:MAG: endonuclease/exonuclease/phosphatase family protein [Kiritimatiellae bacterium]|jgi:exodeoxyribonuclease-3|nr:endonuclease/exonuclease/phosphatase family protein [Kiritimatiellia bacterium]